MRTIPGFKFWGMILCMLAWGALAAEAPSKFKVGEFNFTRPSNWEWVDVSASPMRKAQLKIGGKDKAESAEVVFFYFGESGAGATQANVDRWLGQFQEPEGKLISKVEEVTLGKHKVTFVHAEGTYKGSMLGGGPPPTPLANAMLLGA